MKVNKNGMKLRIAVDANEANNTVRTGIGQYAYGILKALSRLAAENINIEVFLKSQPLEFMPEGKKNFRYVIPKGYGPFVETRFLPFLYKAKLSGEHYDFVWSLTHYSPVPSPYPAITSVMDLAYLRFPGMFLKKDLYKLKYWTYISVKQAKLVFTISNFSKNEINFFYPFAANKTHVIYPGYETGAVFSKKQMSEKFKLKGNYLIFVGTFQPRKNLSRLIDAYLSIKGRKPGLVVAGMKSEGRGGWMNDEVTEKISRLKDIVLTGFAERKELLSLIGHSDALLMPSLYEGFGLPVVEALSMDVPVVVSRNSSLAELAGDLPSYIEDPYNISSIRKAIENSVINNRKLRQKIKMEKVKYLGRFSYNKSAEKAVRIMKETVNKNN